MESSRISIVGARSQLAEAKVTLLPFSTEKSVKANVSTYFRVQNDTEHENTTDTIGAPIGAPLKASFRGRDLRGRRLRPSAEAGDGCVGLVCREERSAPQQWTVSKKFSELTYFNHDKKPGDSDIVRRWLTWPQLARAVHTPLATDDDVDALLQRAPQVAASAAAAAAAATGDKASSNSTANDLASTEESESGENAGRSKKSATAKSRSGRASATAASPARKSPTRRATSKSPTKAVATSSSPATKKKSPAKKSTPTAARKTLSSPARSPARSPRKSPRKRTRGNTPTAASPASKRLK